MKKCKPKINKKSFVNLCKSKLDELKLEVCRTELDEMIYDLTFCKDNQIDYVALHTYVSPTTVKRVLKKFYDRALNLPLEMFIKIFDDTK